jgi:hypothetical protein
MDACLHPYTAPTRVEYICFSPLELDLTMELEPWVVLELVLVLLPRFPLRWVHANNHTAEAIAMVRMKMTRSWIWTCSFVYYPNQMDS